VLLRFTSDSFLHNLYQTEALSIPLEWCKTYGNIFSQALSLEGSNRAPSLILTPTEPIMLTEVYVTALSLEAYQVACSRDSVLETWLSDDRKILRLGMVHTFWSHDLPLNGHGPSSELQISFKYRVDMVEPVLQGFSQKGTTRFIVTMSANNYNDLNSNDFEIADDEPDSDQEGIEIDEDFLANSTLTRFLSPSPNGHHLSANLADSENSDQTQTYFQTHPLSAPGNITNEHCTLYLRTADLGRIGILSGDWASTVVYHL
jgi:peroxin-6